MVFKRPSLYAPTPLIAAALASAAAFAVCGGLLYQVLALDASNAALDAALVDKTGEEHRLASVAHLAEATRASRAALSTLVIPTGGNAAFISSLEALGRATKTSAKTSSITAAAPSGTDPGSLSPVVSFSGSYGAVMRFVALVETEHAALLMSSLSLQYDEASTQWQGALTLSALSLDTP